MDDAADDDWAEERLALESIFGEEDFVVQESEARVRLDDRGLFGSEVWLRCLEPTTSRRRFDVTSLASRLDDEREALAAVATEAGPSVYAAVVAANEALADLADERAAKVVEKVAPPPLRQLERRLARTILYSHHIIATSKREGLKQLSVALGVTTLVKIGWPGVIVLEGQADCVALFVNVIQKWRWKHLVVRGEEFIDLPPPGQNDKNDDDCGSARALRRAFVEYGPNDMAALSKTCHGAGLGDLFSRVFRRN